MDTKEYRVVRTEWRCAEQVETPVSDEWKSEKEALKDPKELTNGKSMHGYSIQKKPKD